MQVVVPFAAGEPKTRLAGTLSADERREFALVMLEDVLGTIRATGRCPRVLTTREIDIDAPLSIDTRPLTPAVNAVLSESAGSEADSTAIVMADLALATPDALERLFSATATSSSRRGVAGGRTRSSPVIPAFGWIITAPRISTTSKSRRRRTRPSPNSTPIASRRTWTSRTTSRKCCCMATVPPAIGSKTPGSRCR